MPSYNETFHKINEEVKSQGGFYCLAFSIKIPFRFQIFFKHFKRSEFNVYLILELSIQFDLNEFLEFS